ncbi:MAG: pyridoxamine 5'-phosphate oxidase family protein [Dehalococcoidia bacterium]|nr:pyridoxamine 5'-phosphate oxidase family protein [Dehalococcoidia bacterium]
MPKLVDELLQRALVCELAVIGADGRLVVHPLIPLWDGERVYMTSSILFSRKLEHIKRDGRVSLSITDPVATGGLTARCSIQGDARVVEDDPHETWEQVLPLWRAKEPAIDQFLGKRFALPLFFERSIIEVTPRRVYWWDDGDPSKPPRTATLAAAEAAR